MASKIDPTGDAASELTRLLRKGLEAATAACGDHRQSTKARIHRARTSIKKCRALLKLIRTAEEQTYRHENRALRRAARQLSAVRDADVLLDTLNATLQHHGMPRPKFAPIRRRLLAGCRATKPSPAAIERRLRAVGEAVRAICQRSGAWAAEVTLKDISKGHAETYRRARRALHRADLHSSAEELHEWRKATKSYYHQCRALRAIWPAEMKATCAALKELEHLLGEDHDLAALDGSLRGLARESDSGTDDEPTSQLTALIESRRDDVRHAALPLGARLFAEKPKAIKARTIRWWRAARDEIDAHGAV